MIDNPYQVADLIEKIERALPLPAIVTPYLADSLRKQSPQTPVTRDCQVVWISNLGDEGGIVCKLAMQSETDGKMVFLTSITHLAFHPRHPLTREITAYQKHRVKKLRRQPSYSLNAPARQA